METTTAPALLPGDPAPHFRCRSSVNPKFNFDTVAGRYVVLSFLGSAARPVARRVLDLVAARADRFDVSNAVFFGVTCDADDVDRLAQEDPGRMYFFDLDLAVSRLYGLVDGPGPGGAMAYTTRTFVLDHALRVVASIGLGEDADPHVAQVFEVLDALPPTPPRAATSAPLAASGPAPVLVVPYVFEPDLCRELIEYYERAGGRESGFMRDVGGRTVEVMDPSHKRRMDCEVTDRRLIAETQDRLSRRVAPAIRQAYQFDATRIERHVVACYDASQGAHFRAHRDNTTLGTAHRRFAVTINLNADEYDGGEIWFPEFGPTRYKAPSGHAIVFSCSLLHEVPKVTRGRRYAFLPFLYDDAAAAVRDRNRQYVGAVTAAA
ncbi:MAG TPA: 2OG-Fe(II) oxygenase, partial [Humisphaera sp.]